MSAPTVLFASDYNSEIAALRMFVKVSTEKSIRLVKRSLEKLFVTDATHLRKVFIDVDGNIELIT